MPASSLFALLLSRAATEGLVVAVATALLSTPLGGPLPLPGTWAGIVALLLLAGGTALAARRRRTRVIVTLGTVAIAAAVAALTALRTDAQLVGSRVFAGLVIGAVVGWRGFAIPEDAHAWRAMAWSALLATLAAAGAALHPATRGDLAPVAIATGSLAVVGLSAARGSEELLAARRRGRLRARATAAVSAFLVGLGALAGIVFAPQLRHLGEQLAPLIEQLVFALLVLVVTPFGYLAEWLAPLVVPLLGRLRDFQLRLPQPFREQLDPAQEEEIARQVAATSEVVLKVVVVLIVTLVLTLLLLRVLAARRVALPLGASLERERIEGIGVLDLLRRLFPASAEARPPRPTGTDPAARVRRAYWELLALAERAGPGWRDPPQTPREHAASLGGDPWAPAGAVVTAFERVRYGERATSADAEEAEAALARLRDAVVRTQ